MLNDRDEKYEGQEEGEYHFSDDQINYETESEIVKEPPSQSKNFKEAAIEKIKQNKRIIIGLVVFVLLIFIIYKMLGPAQQPAEFSQLPNQGKPMAVPPQTQVTTQTSSTTSQSPAIQSAPSTAAPQPAMTIQAQIPPAQPTTVSPAPVSAAPTSTTGAPVTTTVQPPSPPPGVMQQDKSPLERLAAVEEQTNKIVNVLQTEFVPKITDNSTQNAATQAKIQEISARVAEMEANINKIMQLLQKRAVRQSGTVYTPPPVIAARPVESRSIYTVQAIIPGRAWLKSESGDTVTVAEGDIIKGFGRVVKIDPYDGIVSIDSGSRMISLSYGSSGD